MSYEKVTQDKTRIVIGVKQTLKAMRNGEVSEVFIADDANQQLTQKVASLAMELDIPCHRVGSKVRLGAACDIEVNASSVAIKK